MSKYNIQNVNFLKKNHQQKSEMTTYEPIQRRFQSKIKHETRLKLISLVHDKKISIKKACRILKMHYSTGKLIVKKYNHNGLITKFSYEKASSSQEKVHSSKYPILVEPIKNLRNDIIQQRANETHNIEQNQGKNIFDFNLWNSALVFGGCQLQGYGYWMPSLMEGCPWFSSNNLMWYV